jgi:hypothetical protein
VFGDVEVGPDEVVHDDVVCIGGTATVAGKVEGSVVVVGGHLKFSGEAREVVVVGGKSEFSGTADKHVAVLARATLGSGAVIHGEFVHVLGQLTRAPEAVVQGKDVEVGSHLHPRLQRILSRGLMGIFIVIRIISILISGVVLLIIAALAPERIDRMAEALPARWPSSLGFGFLAWLGFGVLFLVLFITLIGIPLAVLLGLGAWVLSLVGVASLLVLFGRRLGAGTGLLDDAPSVMASMLVGFLALAIIRFIPVLGELVWYVVIAAGLGLALITRVGSPGREAAAP